MHIGIDAETLKALDWNAVLEALSEQARTPRGRTACTDLVPATDPACIRAWLDEVDEVARLEADGTWVPVGGVEDVAEDVARADKGAVLEVEVLRRIGRTLAELDRLAQFVLTSEAEVPRLRARAPALQVDPSVADTLAVAFDDTGQLSARTYPELGALRERVASLHASIRRTLEDLVRGDALADVLQDRYVTQRGERYVLPVKANTDRRSIGIVHGMSGSGQTAFVEPHEVVALNNDLRIAEGQLEAVQRRILTDLSRAVARVAVPTLRALEVAEAVDVACARSALTRALDGVRPVVGGGGVVRLVAARHPLLVLRDVAVVPNDLGLDDDAPVLVVSGPNTGGKTVALKTLGLCALLVRIGCGVPAAEGSRVDVFADVLALVGDHQTVQGDHSSFSSHLAMLHAMLDRAGSRSLLLVDEIASGTDPEQGAALAHAVLERFLQAGARALVTTHFQRLKALSADEPRIAVAGMQFAHGEPTYRMVRGASGDSHALEIALRNGFDPDLVDRARGLMDAGERNLAEALAALDRERARAEEASRDAESLRAELAEAHRRVAAREQELAGRTERLARERAQAFLDRVAAAEKAVGEVVTDLQRAPSHEGVAAAKAALKGLGSLAPAPAPAAPAEEAELAVGDRVRLSDLSEVGEVLDVGRTVRVRTSRGLTVQVPRDQLVRLGGPVAPPPPRPPAPPRPTTPRDAPAPLDGALRTEGNTLDLRGQRVDEGLDALEQFLDRMVLDDRGVVFVLHGHGTGAMKQAVRRYLAQSRYVVDWKPAQADQGGDAYTVAALG